MSEPTDTLDHEAALKQAEGIVERLDVAPPLVIRDPMGGLGQGFSVDLVLLARCHRALADEVEALRRERSDEYARLAGMTEVVDAAHAERDEARANLAEASRAWDGPETTDWIEGARKEAAHQIARWGTKHDAGKDPEAWFWLVGYLAGKLLAAHKAGDIDKAKHHTIATGAALLNWHANLSGHGEQMRPGINPPPDEAAPQTETPT